MKAKVIMLLNLFGLDVLLLGLVEKLFLALSKWAGALKTRAMLSLGQEISVTAENAENYE